MQKRGQAWSFDLIIAGIIFLGGIIVFYLYIVNSTQVTRNSRSIENEALSVSDTILSEGVPKNWDTSNVIKIGLISENKLNETKINQFKTISDANYNTGKQLLGTTYNYFLNLSEPIVVLGSSVSSVGLEPTGAKNIVRIARVAVYQNKTITLGVYLWN